MHDVAFEPPADYQAALSGAVYRDEADAGRIFMRGRDRAALLHRLSTNDIEHLLPGQGVRTVLTTPIGRIIDVLTVHALEDALLVVTSPGQGPPVFGHVKRNIFFNDQVTLEPAGRSHGQLAVYGPAAADLLAQLAEAAPSDLMLNHTITVPIAGIPVLVARVAPIGGAAFRLYVPSEGLEAVRNMLAACGVMGLTDATYDVLRVEQGYAAFGRELSQEYIPLETGLLDAVSFTKGCYVGQEIIARMESRNRLAKTLRGLRFGAGLEAPVAPARLEVERKEAGDLTSAVRSPRFGPIGLAYVRTAYAEPGTVVGIAGSDQPGEVVELPFVSA